MLLNEHTWPDQPEVEFHWLRVGHCQQLEALSRSGGRFRRIDFPSLVGLIGHRDHGWTLFDTGYADHYFAATARLPERLYRDILPVWLPSDQHLVAQLHARGISPADIRRIVVSHFHADHVGGLRDFPAAEVVAGRSGLEQITSLGRINALRHGLLPSLLPDDVDTRLVDVATLPEVPQDAPFTLWDLTGDGALLVVDLPGHMPGHIGLLINHRGERLLLAGDAAWSRTAVETQTTPPGPVLRIFDDPATVRRTLGALHDVDDPPRLTVLPSHCAPTWEQWQRDHG